MIEKNLSTLKINKLTKAQFEQAFAQNRIQSDQLYMVADESSDEEQYLPLTGGALTSDDGASIGLYPSSDDGAIREPSIEIANNAGDHAHISPAAVGLKYSNQTAYMSAEESYIEVKNGIGSATMYPDNLQIQDSDTVISLSAQGGEIVMRYNDSDYMCLCPEVIDLNYNSQNIILACDEGHISMTTNLGYMSLDPQTMIANGATLTFPTKSGTLALTSDLDDIQTQLDDKSTVTFARSLTSGQAIGTITIDGISKTLYTPKYITSGKKSGTTIGDYATAEGYGTTASGQRSHAEGASTTASGSYSHAEGQSTTASAFNSHAEGDRATASGSASHAEGCNTTASGIHSHAEGEATTASGTCSHAEGDSTVASCKASHAEGGSTTVTDDATVTVKTTTIIGAGYYGHAEGYGTVSYGTCSHAEGHATRASGRYSHAEGWYSIASGKCSHAEGEGAIAMGEDSHAEGRGGTYGSSTYTFTRTSTQYQYTCDSSYALSPGEIFKDENGTYAIMTAVSGTESPYLCTLDKDFVTTEGETANLYSVAGIAFGQSSHVEGS